jgi:hypothetical protein
MTSSAPPATSWLRLIRSSAGEHDLVFYETSKEAGWALPAWYTRLMLPLWVLSITWKQEERRHDPGKSRWQCGINRQMS